MILSTNIIDKEDDDKDSSSDDSIKDEGLTELKNIIEINRQSNYYIYNFFIIQIKKKKKFLKM